MIIVVTPPKIWELICSPSFFPVFFSWRRQKLAADEICRIYFLLLTFSKASSIVSFPFWNTHTALRTNQRLKHYFRTGFYTCFFNSVFILCIPSLTKTEMNGIPFWKGMRNRCKHTCVRQGILWNLFNWKRDLERHLMLVACWHTSNRHSRVTAYVAT